MTYPSASTPGYVSASAYALRPAGIPPRPPVGRTGIILVVLGIVIGLILPLIILAAVAFAPLRDAVRSVEALSNASPTGRVAVEAGQQYMLIIEEGRRTATIGDCAIAAENSTKIELKADHTSVLARSNTGGIQGSGSTTIASIGLFTPQTDTSVLIRCNEAVRSAAIAPYISVDSLIGPLLIAFLVLPLFGLVGLVLFGIGLYRLARPRG